LSTAASIDLALMRASTLLESDPAAAAQRAAAIIAQAPQNSEAQLLLAAAHRKLGDPLAALAVLERLSEVNAHSPVMQLELGRACEAAGHSTDALAAFRRAVSLDAGLADGWRELAAAYFAAGDDAAGDRAYATYIKLIPDPPHLSDARVALASNRLVAAADILQRRLKQAPHDVAALRLLAEAANRWGDESQAERRLRQCLELAPGYAAARADLARMLHIQQRSAEVLPLLERLLNQDPTNWEYLGLKAQTLRLVGRMDEGIALLRETLAQEPREEGLWLLYGHLLREVGQQAQAIDAYRRALELRPGLGRAYWSLANLKTFRFAAPDLAAMQEQLGRPGVRGVERVHLEFALGKALEDDARYENAFEHYARGNALQRATMVDHPDATTAELARAKKLYTANFFSARAGWGCEQRDPIFIVGVPRSGSTLLEQILASHSQIEGTRELPEMIGIVRELMSRPAADGTADYPQAVAQLTRAQVAGLAARYLERTQLHRVLGKPRFIDKMLGNYAHLGLIQLMFPRAVIIDARRHPVACGFSCYKQLFTRPLAFTYSLEEFTRFYREYDELMEHFDAVLPGRVYRVYYEQLIADPETEVRRLLHHCGMEFEAQCLRFYENPRAVMTISSEQVRQPLYADSVDQWRSYEPWLGPLKEGLRELVERYPAVALTAPR
jgi:tetratricopeptide (TPR) repeat protein